MLFLFLVWNLFLAWIPLLISQLFIAVALLLSGLGIYLGRVERWNSWDIVFQPQAVLQNVVEIFASPFSHQQAFLMMGLFSILLSLLYWLSLYSKTEQYNSNE